MSSECPDSEDEADCACADFLRAQSLEKKVCDGIVDCWDYSDESSCDWCRDGQYVCGNSKFCVDPEKVCDGVRDCPNSEDEKKCAALMDDLPRAKSSLAEENSTVTYYEVNGSPEEEIMQEGTLTDVVSGREISPKFRTNFLQAGPVRGALKTETYFYKYNDDLDVNNYNDRGYLSIRKNGRWGKLCVTERDRIQHKNMSWTIEDLGKAFCKAITYQDLDAVESINEGNSVRDTLYYSLSVNDEKSGDETSLTFKPTVCDSRQVLKVKCKNFECGIRTQATRQARVVGGGSSASGSWPWQIALYKEGEYQCGAVLISDRWAISAAHCFYRAQKEHWVARVGATRRGSFPSPYEKISRLDHIVLHPDYVDNGFINDIALLRLEQPVRFSDYIRPICLPKSEPRSGMTCTVTGWGQLFEVGRIFPDALQEVELPLISTEECRRKTLFLPLYRITSGMLCAGYRDGGKDACLGDSGGPLVCSDSGNKFVLHGITSNGYGCGRAGRPGVYSKVHHYLGWIERVTSRRDTGSSASGCQGHRCPLGECLPSSRVCNGFVDCEDASDERDCHNHHPQD